MVGALSVIQCPAWVLLRVHLHSFPKEEGVSINLKTALEEWEWASGQVWGGTGAPVLIGWRATYLPEVSFPTWRSVQQRDYRTRL